MLPLRHAIGTTLHWYFGGQRMYSSPVTCCLRTSSNCVAQIHFAKSVFEAFEADAETARVSVRFRPARKVRFWQAPWPINIFSDADEVLGMMAHGCFDGERSINPGWRRFGWLTANRFVLPPGSSKARCSSVPVFLRNLFSFRSCIVDSEGTVLLRLRRRWSEIDEVFIEPMAEGFEELDLIVLCVAYLRATQIMPTIIDIVGREPQPREQVTMTGG